MDPNRLRLYFCYSLRALRGFVVDSGDYMTRLRKNIAEMAGYVPGFQPEDEAAWIKLNTNENPYPPSPKVKEAILAELGKDGGNLRKYPDAGSREMRRITAELHGFDPSWVITANGSDELLNNLIRAYAGEGEEIGYVHPSYSYYATLAEIQGAKVQTFGLTEDFRIKDFPERYPGKIFFLTSPNAPLGFAFPLDYIAELANRCTGVLVVDEAYVDFADQNALVLVKEYDNVIITRTLSKSYSLAGMRLGLAIARPEVIGALDKIRDHYHLDRLALLAGQAALSDQAWLLQNVARIRVTRERFVVALREIGYSVITSCTNFIFASPADRDGKRVYEGLYQRKILVRHFTDPLLAHGLRISVGTDAEMDATLAALREIG
jgi:histidinol-phosphate aminotransferase